MKTKKLPIEVIILCCILTIFIILALINAWYTSKITNFDKKYLSFTNDLIVMSQSISKDSNEAMDGNIEAFRRLKDSQDRFTLILNKLQKKEQNFNISATSPLITDEKIIRNLNYLTDYWQKEIKDNIDFILRGQGALLNIYEDNSTYEHKLNKIITNLNKIINIEIANNISLNYINKTYTQKVLLYKIHMHFNKLLSAKSDVNKHAKLLVDDIEVIIDNSKDLKKYFSNTRQKKIPTTDIKEMIYSSLDEINIFFTSLKNRAEKIIDNANDLAKMDAAAENIYLRSNALLVMTESLKNSYMEFSEQRFYGATSSYTLVTLIIITLLSLIYIIRINFKKHFERLKMEKTIEDNTIKQLLNELHDLANGNLAVRTIVKEGIIGRIADTFNYSLNALTKLVILINDTTEKVFNSTDKIQHTTNKQAEASIQQSREIVSATVSVNAMAASIEEISNNASKSTTIAKESINIANNGVSVVKDAIIGIEHIADQIQETSHLIKRLGEDSKEAGDIILLIEDIADQTTILSLNATIQAAIAGEAGKGFSVVAEEIQRLADSSRGATKKIGTLIKTIQTDTNQAVNSMNKTTSKVIEGAQFTEDAGVALETIENVSKDLAKLIQNISKEAGQQSKTALKISKTMDIIKEIAVDATSGTRTTANSIKMLAELVSKLKYSVSGFRLPPTQND